MYFNGYIILSIFIGAYLGFFVFQWEDLIERSLPNSPAREPSTACCG